MASKNRTILKGFFETGDTPSQAQYADLIDSSLNLSDTTTQTIVSPITFTSSEINLTGNLSASGNISASGTGSFSELEVNTNAHIGGDLFVSQYIKHTGDTNTLINFTDNRIQLQAGGIPFLGCHKDSAEPYPLTINNGGNRINLRVQDRNSDLLLKTDSEKFKVNLYHAGDMKLETQAGGVNITGSLNTSGSLDITYNITASGDISSSGTVTGNNLLIDGSQVDFTNLPTSDPSVAGRLYNDGGSLKISAG